MQLTTKIFLGWLTILLCCISCEPEQQKSTDQTSLDLRNYNVENPVDNQIPANLLKDIEAELMQQNFYSSLLDELSNFDGELIWQWSDFYFGDNQNYIVQTPIVSSSNQLYGFLSYHNDGDHYHFQTLSLNQIYSDTESFSKYDIADHLLPSITSLLQYDVLIQDKLNLKINDWLKEWMRLNKDKLIPRSTWIMFPVYTYTTYDPETGLTDCDCDGLQIDVQHVAMRVPCDPVDALAPGTFMPHPSGLAGSLDLTNLNVPKSCKRKYSKASLLLLNQLRNEHKFPCHLNEDPIGEIMRSLCQSNGGSGTDSGDIKHQEVLDALTVYPSVPYDIYLPLKTCMSSSAICDFAESDCDVEGFLERNNLDLSDSDLCTIGNALAQNANDACSLNSTDFDLHIEETLNENAVKDINGNYDIIDISNVDSEQEKKHIPECIQIDNGSEISIEFGTTSDGKSSDQAISPCAIDALASALDCASEDHTINSIYISSTTNGVHSPKSNHSRALAIDISRINGKRMALMNAQELALVGKIQDCLEEYGGIRENFGPSLKKKLNEDYNVPNHDDHVHMSVNGNHICDYDESDVQCN